MKNKNLNDNNINDKKMNSDDFDIFLKSLLNHKKSKQNRKRNKSPTNINNHFFQTIGNNNNEMILKNSEKPEKNLLFSTFSKNNFLTLDQIIEMKNKNLRNISYNKYNSISNIKQYPKNIKINKTSEKNNLSNSNYNLLLVNRITNIKKGNKDIKSISNIQKINNKRKKFKKNSINLSQKKLFETYDNRNSIFTLNKENKNNKNNFVELISGLKNTLKKIENDDNCDNQINITSNNDNVKLSKLNKKNDISRNKSTELYNVKNINKSNIIKMKRKQSPSKKENKVNKLNKEIQYNHNNNNEDKGKLLVLPNNDISMDKYKNYSCPNGLNVIKVQNQRQKSKIKEKQINKSNITMNNNYIFNNFQNKYDLTSYFQKKGKYKNIYSIAYNNTEAAPNLNNKNYQNNNIIRNTYNNTYFNTNINITNHKYKIIKEFSFSIINENYNYNYANIKLKDIKYINKKFLNFFIKIITAYKHLLLKLKKKEKLLLDEIITKNNDIKKIKMSFLKMVYFFKKEMNNSYIKDFIYKKILIEKQLIAENNYLRNLTISKNNLCPNFYSSYENSYDGFVDLIEKGFINNRLKNKNFNDTTNNSPQLTGREDPNNEGFLFRNRNNRIFRNFYILKKNRKEIK